MQSDLVTGVGIQEAGAAGVTTGGPVKKGKWPWWNVDFTSGADGWVAAQLLATASGATPTLSFAAAPTVVTAGGSAALTWTATGATACVASGGTGFVGAVAVSGSASVRPAASTVYALACSGGGGSVSKTATVSVNGATVPAVTLTAAPASVAPGGSSILTWAATNATGCTASGDTSFTGTKPTSGTATVRPAATTGYGMSCTGSGGTSAATTTVTIVGSGGGGGGGAGTAAAFTDPDNGNIPDRPLHPLAFPTAMGFGKHTTVRSANAVVYKINSLADVADPGDGKITYRECAMALAVTTPYIIPAGRPRYCVFDVAGAIVMNSEAPITVPNIYIAGQTSPGGIEFRLGAAFSPVNALIEARRGGNHMILRHIRSRTGEHPGRTSLNGDPIRMSAVNNQILDHVSTMFGTDESLDMACDDCTVQWAIIGPNICQNAGHTSATHCKTFFIKPGANITVTHNLSQDGNHRGVNISPGTNPPMPDNASQADIINNVLYYYVVEQGLVSNQFGDVYANYMGNTSFRGPFFSAKNGNYLIGLYGNATAFPFGFDIYGSGNVTPSTRVAGQFGQTVTDPFAKQAGMLANLPVTTVCALTAGVPDCTRTGTDVVQATRIAVAPGNPGLSVSLSHVTGAEQGMRDVLAYAGADLCRDGMCRDNVDALYIDDVRTCDASPRLYETGWVSTVAAAGGFARLTASAAKVDTDNDGMPDEWENRFANTNALVADANEDRDGDGYPNIEEYLSSLARDDTRYSGFIGSGTGALPAYNCGRAMVN